MEAAVARRSHSSRRLETHEIIDLWTFREALESITIYELAGSLDRVEIDALDGLFLPFDGATVDRHRDEYQRADRAFHDRLLALSRNSLAHRINGHFLILDRAAAAGLLRPPSGTLGEHRAITALRKANRQEARRAMVEHVERTRALVEEAVERLRRIGGDVESMTVEQLQPPATGRRRTQQ